MIIVKRTKTDKESGFESSPNSPRAGSSLEPGNQCLLAAQTELRHQRSAQSSECISLESFKFIKKLGSGGYGSVVLVEKRRGRDRGALYALKMTNLNRAALVERDILPRLQNVPYTTDLAYAFFSASLPKAFLALSYAVGKDLFSLVGPSRSPGYLRRMFVYNYARYVDRMRIVLAELSVAIRFLHENNILYRDLKLENVLVFGDGHVRLADFGLSRHFEVGESTQISGKTGTPDYMAPEVLKSSGAHGPATAYSFEADLWGLGVIAYELIVGQLPFKGREVADLEESILHDPIELPHHFMEEKFSVLLSHEKPMVLAGLSFIRALLQRRPEDRLSNDDIPGHVFFRDLDWESVSSGCHDDPPFDIGRVLREQAPDDEIQRIPSAFTGSPSSKRHRKDKRPNSSGYDNPSKYRNYHYCNSQFGWYVSSLESSRGHDSSEALPENVQVDDDDPPADGDGGTAFDDVPGLLAFESAAADDSCLSSPLSPDSSFGEELDESEPGEEPASPPAAAAAPRQDIQLFPRVRVLPAPEPAAASPQQASPRPRRRRPAADLGSPCLPPKKRRRFLQPEPSLAEMGSVEPRVLVEAQSPLPPFGSLRATRSRAAGLR
ncbi:protein kinase C-like [Pollicipes pollicipes]|uniref:protein kinase C-like n=1 Tax=Pollicipes pollicipes TaxID=41117 RepID=UPI001884D2DC|nr:protein kinase C-like [Pollicipes pollicipes]